MKTVIVLSCVLLMAGLTQAQEGVYNGAMRQAHGAVDKTEAASNQDPDAQSQNAVRSQPPPQTMDPALAATMKNIASLRADLNSLKTNTPPSTGLTNDLTAAAIGTKAPADIIAKLAGDLQTAVAGKPRLRGNFQKLAQYLHATANGAHLTPAQFQTISDDLEQILENGGASYEATQAVLDDIKSLAKATK